MEPRPVPQGMEQAWVSAHLVPAIEARQGSETLVRPLRVTDELWADNRGPQNLVLATWAFQLLVTVRLPSKFQ